MEDLGQAEEMCPGQHAMCGWHPQEPGMFVAWGVPVAARTEWQKKTHLQKGHIEWMNSQRSHLYFLANCKEAIED